MHEVAVDQPTTCEDETFYVNGVKVDSDVDWISSQADEKDEGFVTIHINSRPTEMKVDTGAKCDVMPQETFKRVTTGEQPVKPNTSSNLVAYGGSKIKTTGMVTLSCSLKEQQHSLLFYIVDIGAPPLLGFRACVNMGIVKMSPDVHQLTTESNTDFKCIDPHTVQRPVQRRAWRTPRDILHDG